MLPSVSDEVDWSDDRWAALLEESIREAASTTTTVELRRVSPKTVLIWADPGESGGASLELVVSATECQIFVSDALNAEFTRPNDEHEVDAIVRGVTQHGCRVVKSGLRRYVEIGHHRDDEDSRRTKIEQEWAAWSGASHPAEPEPRLIYWI